MTWYVLKDAQPKTFVPPGFGSIHEDISRRRAFAVAPLYERRNPPVTDRRYRTERRRLTTVGIPRKRVVVMFLILFIVLLVAWLLGWGAFHVAGGFIHLLLIVAVIALIVHFVRGRRAA